jgi:hypothetical protein
MTGTVKWTTEDEAPIPSEQRMMVRTGDWARVRSSVERLGNPIVDWAGIWASIAVGAAIALVAIAVSIHRTTQEPHTELLNNLKLSIAFCIVLAVFAGFVGLREHRKHSDTCEGICDDMDNVARRLGHEGLGVLPKRPKHWIGVKGWVLRVWNGDLTTASNNENGQIVTK